MNKNLVYLSYGSDNEYRRTVFSILSFFAWCDSYILTTRIIIYTDKPDFFKGYFTNREIEYFLLTPSILLELAGPDNFIHRRKVSVIALTFERFPNDDQLFIDSDTFFIASAGQLLKKIEPGKSFMHLREYQIKEAVNMFALFRQDHFPKAFIDFISHRNFRIGTQFMNFTGDDYSWNSGVLGLNSDFSVYMPDVLKLTDEFYANSKWFVSEQLAFSFILQRKTEIIPTADFIHHYWGKRQKILMDELLDNCFSNDFTKKLNDQKSIRSMSLVCKEKIENDLILEQVEIAISFKSWLYAAKKSFEIILKSRFNANIYKQLFLILKRSRQRVE